MQLNHEEENRPEYIMTDKQQLARFTEYQLNLKTTPSLFYRFSISLSCNLHRNRRLELYDAAFCRLTSIFLNDGDDDDDECKISGH